MNNLFRVWPDGEWIAEDDWGELSEDYCDDYFTVALPDGKNPDDYTEEQLRKREIK